MENLGWVVTPSLVLLYSLCVVQWLEESNTKGFKFCLKKQIDITSSLDQFSRCWKGNTKIPVWFFPSSVFFNPRDQHFHVVVLALQSLLAFPCSAAAQLVTTGRYRIRPNPIPPRDLTGFSKHCWSLDVPCRLPFPVRAVGGVNTWHDTLPLGSPWGALGPSCPSVWIWTVTSLCPTLILPWESIHRIIEWCKTCKNSSSVF